MYSLKTLKPTQAERAQNLQYCITENCHRVFDSHDLTYLTKVKVYNQCLMPLLMYGSETWTLNYRQVRQLRTVQQRHLRRILKIKWDHYISNEEALAKACVEDKI